jgi:hypothetical protein
LDIAFTNHSRGNKISVLINNGDKTFKPAVEYYCIAPNGICAGDINNDGNIDFVTNGNIALTTFINNGNGTFTKNEFGFFTEGFSLALGDINNDNKLDIVSTRYYDNYVYVITNSGNGSFSSSMKRYSFNSIGLNFSYDINLADINNDSQLDIILSDYTSFNVIMYNNGKGNFINFTKINNGGNPTLPYSYYEGNHTAIGDLNNDGNNDLATSNRYSNSLSIITNSASNVFKKNDISIQANPYNILVDDIDNDGYKDIITSYNDYISNYSYIGIYKNNKFNFNLNQNLPLPFLSGVWDYQIGDIDNDGKKDIIVTTGNINKQLSIFYTNPSLHHHYRQQFYQSLWSAQSCFYGCCCWYGHGYCQLLYFCHFAF